MDRLCCFIAAISFMVVAQAQGISVTGTVHKSIPISVNQSNNIFSGQYTKSVSLMKIKLDDKAKKTLQKRIAKYSKDSYSTRNITSTTPLLDKIDLGMNGVPVLDQGAHGSCVTFATTAAIDALLGKGDYVSQLCNLELGSYLSDNSYQLDGWDGSWASVVINQLQTFGIVSKENQNSGLCSGVSSYPLENEEDHGHAMSVADYHKVSENIGEKLYWSTIQDATVAYYNDFDPEAVLKGVKKELSHGHRCSIGVILPVDFGFAGATGTKESKYDTWFLSSEIVTALRFFDINLGGHEMLVTAYDDSQQVTDDNGKTQQGLIKLRNSWGDQVGNNGDFYMTYDFFKVFVDEAVCLFETRKS